MIRAGKYSQKIDQELLKRHHRRCLSSALLSQVSRFSVVTQDDAEQKPQRRAWQQQRGRGEEWIPEEAQGM